METISENWSVLENNYFIKYHFFNMSWIIGENFKDYMIAYEPNGGAIAVMLKSKSGQDLLIYSSSGRMIASKPWPDKFVIGLYWSDNENVLLLQDSGRVAIYTLQCEYVMYVAMGDVVKDSLVKSFRFFPSLQGVGLMVITEKNECYYKTNVTKADSVIKNMKSFKRVVFDTVSDWIVFTDLSDRETVAVFASRNELIKVKYNSEPQVFDEECRWLSQSATINRMSVSMSQASLAMVMTDGRIWLTKSDLSQTIVECKFDFKLPEGKQKQIVQMEWAGEELLVLYFEQCLYLVDVDSQNTSIFYLDEPLLFPEIDGVRLITPTKHEFIQKVPTSLERLCSLADDCPAAWLFDAQRHLESKSADAINYLDQVLRRKGQLERAIDVCVDAAAHCLEPKWQKTILHAVRLGRSYLPHYKSDKVADVHTKLRLLNNLKLPFIAMPLTMAQLEQVSVPVLLDRLCNRRLYPFLERICQQLRVPPDTGVNRMLEYWAECCVREGLGQQETALAVRIIDRLRDHSDFNYARIAETACDLKMYALAETLLEKEGRIEHQVKVWLKLKKNNLALSRSIESGNSDLISSVVARLERDMNNQEFFMLLCKHPVAKTIYTEHLLLSDNPEWAKAKRALDDLDDSVAARAEGQLRAALQAESLQSALAMAVSAQDQYRKLNNDFMVQMLEDQKALLQHQVATVREAGGAQPVPTSSLRDYLDYLLDHGLDDKAESLRQRLKVSERQFQWQRVHAHARASQWEELERTVTRWGRRMPVSVAEVAEICVERAEEGGAALALRFLERVEPAKRVKLLVRMGKLQEAEEVARTAKDDYLLHYVSAMKFSIC